MKNGLNVNVLADIGRPDVHAFVSPCNVRLRRIGYLGNVGCRCRALIPDDSEAKGLSHHFRFPHAICRDKLLQITFG